MPDDLGDLEDDVVWGYTYTTALDGVPAGMLLTVTDALGRVTELRYYGMDLADTDASLLGVLKSITFAVGTADEATVAYAYYTGTRNLHTVTDERGNVTEYVYDQLDRVTMVIEPDPDGPLNPLLAPVWEYTYCNCGRLKTVEDPLGNVTEYEYDDRNRLHKIILPKPDPGDPANPFWEYQYDDGGRLERMIDPAGHETEYVYDDADRLIRVIESDPDGPIDPLTSPEWNYTYDAVGNLVAVEDPGGHTTDYAYDRRGRLIEIVEPEPATAAGRPVWSSVYDAAGQLLSTTDPLGRTVHYDYDPFLGWLTKVTQPDPDGLADPEEGTGLLEASFVEYAYDKLGQLRFVTDALGQTTEHQYDARGRLKATILPDPDDGGPLDPPTTVYTYDDAGNLLSLTDPVGNVTSWAYDNLNRPTSETTTFGSRLFEYDAASNLTKRTDRLGRTIEFSYDDWHRPTFEVWRTGGVIKNIVAYSYDLDSQLTTAADVHAGGVYEYDALGRLIDQEIEIVGLNPTVSFASQYDAAGNRTQLAATIDATADFVNDYSYDALDRLTRVTQQAQGSGTGFNVVADKRVDFAYNLAGQFTSIVRKAGLADVSPTVITSLYDYDLAGRLSSLTHASGFNPAISHGYVYDQANRITEYSYARIGGGLSTVVRTAAFDYDHTNQLIADDRDGGGNDRAYEYDENGNRTEVNSTAWTTGDYNQLESDGTYEYEYDAEGNRIRRTKLSDDTTTRYQWDHRNRLIEVTRHATSSNMTAIHRVKYAYDAFDQRVRRTAEGDNVPRARSCEARPDWHVRRACGARKEASTGDAEILARLAYLHAAIFKL